MTGIRFFEPLFRYLIISWIYQYFGFIYQNTNRDETILESQALSGFLSSSLNVELVYTLLKSITCLYKKTGRLLEVKTYRRTAKNTVEPSDVTQVAAIDFDTSPEQIER